MNRHDARPARMHAILKPQICFFGFNTYLCNVSAQALYEEGSARGILFLHIWPATKLLLQGYPTDIGQAHCSIGGRRMARFVRTENEFSTYTKGGTEMFPATLRHTLVHNS